MLPGGLTKKHLLEEVERDDLADFLPWIAYDPDTHRYLSQDSTLGYIWECTPLIFLGEKMAAVLEGLLALEYGPQAVIQFTLYADNHIAPFVDTYASLTSRDDPMLRQWVDSYSHFLTECSAGTPKMSNIPTRQFRLFVSVKNGPNQPELSDETITAIREFLDGVGLAPRPLEPRQLLSTMRGIFGDRTSEVYDDDVPIRKQVIRAEDEIIESKEHIQIGRRYMKLLTPRVMPDKIDVLKANEFFGGLSGPGDDPEQINVPFLFTLTILPQNMKTAVAAKMEVMGWQKSAGSFVSSLRRRLEEYDWAMARAEHEPLVRFVPALVLLGRTPEQVRQVASRAKRIWEGKGALMQEESYLRKVLFITALPLGYYNDKNFTNRLDRHFFAPVSTLARLLPIQGDFNGVWPPRVAMVGRKGQLVSLDIMSSAAANHNLLIAAPSGKGKSVLTQFLLVSHYRSGMKVRIIDIGYSYRKLTKILGGRFIDMGDQFVLNPFEGIHQVEDLEMTKAVIMQMCYSNRAGIPDEIAYRLVSEAVQQAYEEGRIADGVTRVRELLQEVAREGHEKGEHNEVTAVAETLAFTMGDFVQGGQFAQYFHGASTLDLTHDDWLVLELERLMAIPPLFNVVVLLLINRITAALYLADADQRTPTFILFDEAWRFLRENAEGSNHAIATVIDEGMRRARKYYGSFAIVTQSIMDTERFGTAGQVIRENTQFKFLLESADYAKAKDAKILDYDEFSMRLLESVRTQRPRYSEIFIDGGDATGRGVARLLLDPYSYWMFTSDAQDNRAIEQRVSSGMTYAQAVADLAREEEVRTKKVRQSNGD